MNSKRLKISFSILWVGLFLLLSVGNAQAQLAIRGFGLSGQATVLDSVVEQGDQVFAVLEVQVPTDWSIDAVGTEEGERWEIRAYFYSQSPPFGNPISAEWLVVDSLNFFINDGVDPQRVSLQVTLPEILAANIRSVQLMLAVIGTDNEDQQQFSEPVASYFPVGDVIGLDIPVDTQHRPFLRVQSVSPSRPTIHEPLDDTTVPRNILVRYDLPLDALRRTLQLEIRETPEIGGLLVHRLFLADTIAGTDKELHVNGLNLLATPGVDSLGGLNSLNHRSRLELRMYYNIADQEGEPSDTARVQNLFADLQTETPTLIEPNVGSESPSPDVRVIFRLPEAADSVWLTFEADTLSVEPDPFSPHVLTLVPSLYTDEEHYFVMDGTNIGAGTEWVIANPNGETDQLVSQTIYNVTLSYRDLAGNPVGVATNFGYIWPDDQTTVPPTILAPTPGTVENSTFWVQFELPEQPLPGSVYLLFTAFPSLPGSPHEIHLGQLSAGGIIGVTLNALALDLSGYPVTSVEGANHLTSGSSYLIRVFYQDEHGNPEAGSVARISRYDGSTLAPEILAPASGDTFAFGGTEVVYTQPERGTPGTIKLIIEQTGGPEPDPLSPHTLYLSDADSGDIKNVTIQPTFLTTGEGVDSVHNSGSLISRGRYRMTLAYQDALLNSEATHSITDLLFPSGSNVSVRGSVLNTAVIPNGLNIPLLHLALRAEGESALRGVRFAVEGSLETSDIVAEEWILWSSTDSILQTDLDTPLDSLGVWIGGEMSFDSLVYPINDVERHVIVSARFASNANPANQANLVFRDGTFADCGGDPVYCSTCPIGEPDFALPVEVTRLYVEQDTTFSALVVRWIVQSEFNTLGFRLWRYDPESDTDQIVATYADHEELYGRGSAATATRYSVVDHGLKSGVTYTYHIDAVGMDGLTIFPIALEASGTPATAPANFELQTSLSESFQSGSEYRVRRARCRRSKSHHLQHSRSTRAHSRSRATCSVRLPRPLGCQKRQPTKRPLRRLHRPPPRRRPLQFRPKNSPNQIISPSGLPPNLPQIWGE